MSPPNPRMAGIGRLEGTKRNYFDMENLLTRSLYRVMNNTNRVPVHIANSNLKGHNVDKMEGISTIGIARPNNHKIGNSSDMEMQLKLLAQEICGRVERRYERKLEEARDRDRRETERRLTAIRGEYEAKYLLQVSKLEKEKARLMDQMAERERTLENRMEMRMTEQENELETRRRILENRMTELNINRENFDKVREEWKRKMHDDLEEIRIEREKVNMQTVQASVRIKSDIGHEHELQMWKKRAQELENDADVTRRKMAEIMAENFRLADQIGSMSHLRQELDVTLGNLNETREELANSKLENRRTGDFDRIRKENEDLRNEISRLREEIGRKVNEAVQEKMSDFASQEQRWKRMMTSSKNRIADLSDRCRHLEIERDAMRSEMKTMQKMVSRGSGGGKPKELHQFRPVSPTESSSSLSEGELEILNIRQRIHNLDEIAKELDASVEHFSLRGCSSALEKEELNVEQYDDFCRALRRASFDEKGEVVQKTSSPQKKKAIRVVSPPPPIRKEPEIVEVEKNEESELEKRMKMRENRQKILELAKSPRVSPEPVKKEENEEKSTSANNPLFSGVDPVMAEYMKRVMGNRQNKPTPENAPSMPTQPVREVEVTMGDEMNLEIEPVAQDKPKDDDWW